MPKNYGYRPSGGTGGEVEIKDVDVVPRLPDGRAMQALQNRRASSHQKPILTKKNAHPRSMKDRQTPEPVTDQPAPPARPAVNTLAKVDGPAKLDSKGKIEFSEADISVFGSDVVALIHYAHVGEQLPLELAQEFKQDPERQRRAASVAQAAIQNYVTLGEGQRFEIADRFIGLQWEVDRIVKPEAS